MGDVTMAMPTLSSKVVLINEETIQRGQSVFLYETVIMFFFCCKHFYMALFFQPGVCSLKSLLLLPK